MLQEPGEWDLVLLGEFQDGFLAGGWEWETAAIIVLVATHNQCWIFNLFYRNILRYWFPALFPPRPSRRSPMASIPHAEDSDIPERHRVPDRMPTLCEDR